MARIKKSPHQKRTSDRLWARAVTITPVHRESIMKPNPTSTLRAASGSMAGTRASAGAVIGNRKFPKRSTHLSDDSGWMTKWCVEPRGDAAACCMAVSVPSALYGKIDWRLRRVAMGEDASDESWESKNGCNAPCWIYMAFDTLLPRLLISGKPPPK
jgi:hypothetical protein